MSRIEKKFAELKSRNETAFVAFVMAGDPDFDEANALIEAMPGAGVDVLEIGMPFTDPMADGPTIQLAGQRALDQGMTLAKTLETVRLFREKDDATPIVLMGYYNPIYSMGVDAFLAKAKETGVDGLIVVDLPPEEDSELCAPARAAGLDFIRLTTPTTNDERLPAVAANTSGFVYYVSITGITGAAVPEAGDIAPDVERMRKAMKLPICTGFGVRTPETARAIGEISDGVVVGSAIVKMIEDKRPHAEILAFVKSLSDGAKGKV